FDISLSTWLIMATLFGVAALALPVAAMGMEATLQRNPFVLVMVAAGIVLVLVFWFVPPTWPEGRFTFAEVMRLAFLLLFALAALVSVMGSLRQEGGASRAAVKTLLVTAVAVSAILALLSIDFGLPHVRTAQWGGLMVTLVVAITGIV